MNSFCFFTVFTLPGSPLLYNSLRKISQGGNLNLANNLLRSQSYQKVVFDAPEDSSLEKEPLTSEYS